MSSVHAYLNEIWVCFSIFFSICERCVCVCIYVKKKRYLLFSMHLCVLCLCVLWCCILHCVFFYFMCVTHIYLRILCSQWLMMCGIVYVLFVLIVWVCFCDACVIYIYMCMCEREIHMLCVSCACVCDCVSGCVPIVCVGVL